MELSNVLGEREALERLPDAAVNRLDSLRWEQRRLDKTAECRRLGVLLQKKYNERFKRMLQGMEQNHFLNLTGVH